MGQETIHGTIDADHSAPYICKMNGARPWEQDLGLYGGLPLWIATFSWDSVLAGNSIIHMLNEKYKNMEMVLYRDYNAIIGSILMSEAH